MALFPGAGSVHLYHAVDSGLFAEAGLNVKLHEVTSSREQLSGWDEGRFDLMHTSPDHLLKGGRKGDPVVVRTEAVGEISVYVRPGVDLAAARWAVDSPDSAFALVLRAVLADVVGVEVDDERLVPVGGTRQRADALAAGEADGAALHPPFDSVLAARGFVKVGGHLDVLPELATVVAVARRADAGSETVANYLRACEASSGRLVAGGAARIAEALRARGWDEPTARAAGEAMMGPAGIGAPSRPAVAPLRVAARLRQRFVAGWAPADPLEALVAPAEGSAAD